MKKSIIAGIILILMSPVLSAQCPGSGAFEFTYNGKSYRIYQNQLSWQAAADCAVQSGGKLVELDTIEQDCVFSAIINGAGIATNYTTVNDGGGIAYVWIGANDLSTEGNWVWDGNGDSTGTLFWTGEGAAGSNNGSPANNMYHNWGGKGSGTVNEPDDFNNIQDAAAIGLSGWPSGAPGALGAAGEWNDINQLNQLYYVVEYNCLHSTSSISPVACDSFVSPSGKYVWDSSGTYQDTVPNQSGCDSMITVQLTVISIDTTTSFANDTLYANLDTAGSYQWLRCDSSFKAINGATNPWFEVTSSGDYAVAITENSCTDTSECRTIILLRNENSREGYFDLYPNPASEFIEIHTSHSGPALHYTLLDAHGKVIDTKVADGNNMKIFIDELPDGLYFIKLDTQWGPVFRRFVKQK